MTYLVSFFSSAWLTFESVEACLTPSLLPAIVVRENNQLEREQVNAKPGAPNDPTPTRAEGPHRLVELDADVDVEAEAEAAWPAEPFTVTNDDSFRRFDNPIKDLEHVGRSSDELDAEQQPCTLCRNLMPINCIRWAL